MWFSRTVSVMGVAGESRFAWGSPCGGGRKGGGLGTPVLKATRLYISGAKIRNWTWVA